MFQYPLRSRTKAAFVSFIPRRPHPQSSPSRVCRRSAQTSMAAGPALMEEDLKLTSRDGTSIGAFLVHGRSGSFEKAILLLTDILGYTNEDTRNVARRMATAGFPTSTLSSSPWLFP